MAENVLNPEKVMEIYCCVDSCRCSAICRKGRAQRGLLAPRKGEDPSKLFCDEEITKEQANPRHRVRRKKFVKRIREEDDDKSSEE